MPKRPIDAPPSRAAVQGYSALVRSALARDGLNEEEIAELEASKPRKRPEAREAREQAALTDAARTRWWWPGYRHHEQARVRRAEAVALERRGVRSGWPDVTLHIPERWCPSMDRYLTQRPVLAALELKTEGGRPTKAQLDCLSLLESCGYATKVAWGWEEALAWLDEQAGPRPDRLPEGWE